jgi:pyruvate,water dikinase
MKKGSKFIVWFEDVGKDDLLIAGGKGANLGEMTRAGIPVPPGFIVTAYSYSCFLKKSGLQVKIRHLLEPLDTNDTESLRETSARVKEVILSTKMPQEIAQEIREAYARLRGLVAVRSSATAEDLLDASFAGQQSTFLNVEGGEEVVRAVQGCWASLFEPRAIFYRDLNNIDHTIVSIAVPVQRMVQSEVSGVMFTVEPVTNEDEIVIEAVYGLGEAIVSGEATPDLYTADKSTFAILSKNIAKQERQIVRSWEKATSLDETDVWVTVAEAAQERQKLSDEEIVRLAKLGVQIEELYRFPQDIEWAKEGKELYIVQARPITTLKPPEERVHIEELPKGEVLVIGSAASPGLGAGMACIILDTSQISDVREGCVIVAKMTTPDFVPAMKRAAGIVTDLGGRTCHAAIVSRELGVPCVVGTGNATTVLKPGQEVTVDGYRGEVLAGQISETKAAVPAPGAKLKTRTKVYVNLADPELAERVAERNVDGVGLLRAEFIIAHIGEHPKYMLHQGRGEEFIQRLAEGIATFTKVFHPRPVVYRTTDFKTNEYRNLKGGELYEEEEGNPMLGYRGCCRYIRDAETFKLELEAIKRVRQRYNNLWVMLPFVRTPQGLTRAKEIMAEEGLKPTEDFKLWMMVEVPSNVLLIDKFLDLGIDGISIGSNDLTQLILGVDRDNSKLAEEFNERNEAVLMALEKVIKAATERGVTASICGQAPSDYPEITEKLVEWGITSVSVNPDVIEKTREVIAAVESRLGKP